MQAPPPSKFVGHRTLKSNWTYFSVGDSDYVVGVKLVVSKVMRLMDDGKPTVDNLQRPAYWFETAQVIRILSKEEWLVVKEMEKQGDSGD